VRQIPTVGEASSVAFAPDGQLVVANGGRRAPVQVFDPQTGRVLAEFPCSWCKAQCALFSADGQTLLCGGHDHPRGPGAGWGKIGRILRWNLKTGRQRRALVGPEHDVGFACLSPDGRHLASGGDDGTALLWDLATRKALTTFRYRSGGWRVVAFSPDGDTLAITAGSGVELWDPRTLKRRRVLRGHRGTAFGVAFTPDGRLLLSGGADGTVRLWDPATGKERARLDWGIGPVNNVAVAPDGMTAAAGSEEGRIVVWDLDVV
jgi:WD40 repeat protein